MQETLYVLHLVFSGINLYVHIKLILQNFEKMKKGSQRVRYKYRYRPATAHQWPIVYDYPANQVAAFALVY